MIANNDSDPRKQHFYQVLHDQININSEANRSSQVICILQKSECPFIIVSRVYPKSRRAKVVWPKKGYVTTEMYRSSDDQPRKYYVQKIENSLYKSTLPDSICSSVQFLWDSIKKPEDFIDLEIFKTFIRQAYKKKKRDIQRVAEQVMGIYGEDSRMYWCGFLKSYEHGYEISPKKIKRELERRQQSQGFEHVMLTSLESRIRKRSVGYTDLEESLKKSPQILSPRKSPRNRKFALGINPAAASNPEEVKSFKFNTPQLKDANDDSILDDNAFSQTAFQTFVTAPENATPGPMGLDMPEN